MKSRDIDKARLSPDIRKTEIVKISMMGSCTAMIESTTPLIPEHRGMITRLTKIMAENTTS